MSISEGGCSCDPLSHQAGDPDRAFGRPAAPYGLAGPRDMNPKIVSRAWKIRLMPQCWRSSTRSNPIWTSQDYRDFAMQRIAEQKRLVEALGLKRD
jgi:hypothetical protein